MERQPRNCGVAYPLKYICCIVVTLPSSIFQRLFLSRKVHQRLKSDENLLALYDQQYRHQTLLRIIEWSIL